MILVYIFLGVAVVYLARLLAKLIDKLCGTVEKIDEIHEKLCLQETMKENEPSDVMKL